MSLQSVSGFLPAHVIDQNDHVSFLDLFIDLRFVLWVAYWTNLMRNTIKGVKVGLEESIRIFAHCIDWLYMSWGIIIGAMTLSTWIMWVNSQSSNDLLLSPENCRKQVWRSSWSFQPWLRRRSGVRVSWRDGNLPSPRKRIRIFRLFFIS